MPHAGLLTSVCVNESSHGAFGLPGFPVADFHLEYASGGHSGGTVQDFNLVVYSLSGAKRYGKHMRFYF